MHTSSAWIPVKDCSTAQFEGHLRIPSLPGTWLRGAARVAMAWQNPQLMRGVAEHPNTPPDVRHVLVRALPWLALTDMLRNPAAHPELQTLCAQQLNRLWPRMNLAAMEDFAGQAPQSLWPRIWRTAKPSVINHFLRNPELDAPSLSALIRPPLTHDQVVALHKSEFLMDKGIVFQVLRTMARSFQDPDTDLVLGLAAPWIMALRPSERLEVAEALVYPPMERLAQVWGSRFNPPA